MGLMTAVEEHVDLWNTRQRKKDFTISTFVFIACLSAMMVVTCTFFQHCRHQRNYFVFDCWQPKHNLVWFGRAEFLNLSRSINLAEVSF